MTWSQFQAILWLRWRLTRNQFARGGQLNAVLSLIILGMMVVGGLALGGAGFLGGWLFLGKVPAQVLLLIWDGVVFLFLVFWLSGLMAEVQRSESIDLTKLLHLPVTLERVFVFNYVASHLSPVLALMLPGMLGLAAGLALGKGPALILLLPLVVCFVFMVTAWTYCLRGWLAALMINKRRRRAVIVWMTIGLVAVAQLPNVLFNSAFFRQQTRPRSSGGTQTGPFGRDGRGLPPVVIDAHAFVPPGWVGYGTLTLAEGNFGPALGATAACFLLGAFGLMRAYRMTLRFYRGAENGQATPRAVSKSPKPQARPAGVLLVERRLPGVPDDIAALALATFRSLMRAPEIKMALIMPLVAAGVLLTMVSTRGKHAIPSPLAVFATTVAAVVSVFAIAPMMSNAFGLDRNGFRALVLLPTQRHRILLAKNLAFFPFAAGSALVLLTLVWFCVHASWSSLCTAVLQVPLAFLIFSLACNTIAILAPYRLAAGTLQAKKPKPVVFLAAFITVLLLPLGLLPVLIPPGLQFLFNSLEWVPWLPVNLLTTLGLLALVAWLYRLVLPSQGRLLQRREQSILKEVTEDTE